MTDWTAETAEWYAREYGEHPTNRLAVEALDLDAKAVVVDVGCGTGSALRHAAAEVTEGTLIGVDPVPRMIELAWARAEGHPAEARIELRLGSAEELPVDDETADVVLAFDSFDHWADTARGLAEVRRILRAAGRFVVVKDGGVPGGNAARRELLEALGRAGFVILDERCIDEDGVRFTMWVCGVGDRSPSGTRGQVSSPASC